MNPKYGFDDGLFSGYDPNKRSYDASTWALEKDENGIPKRDMTLQDERCVFQLLKKHYSRYTFEKVTAITGTPQDDLEKVYKAYASTGTPDKAGTVLYAMGWTQHTLDVSPRTPVGNSVSGCADTWNRGSGGRITCGMRSR